MSMSFGQSQDSIQVLVSARQTVPTYGRHQPVSACTSVQLTLTLLYLAQATRTLHPEQLMQQNRT